MRNRVGTNPLRTFFLSLFLLTIASTAVIAAMQLEVGIRSQFDLKRLLQEGFDVVYVTDGQIADVVVYTDDELERLRELGFQYEVRLQNIEQYLADRLQPARDDMGGYYTLEEIEDEIFGLAEDFDHIVSEPLSIGESIEGRDIWAVKISDNPNQEEDEPEVLFTALIHAREVITPHVLIETMQDLCENYQDDEYLTRLVDEREIWFIPCHNPDGYAANEERHPNGGGMHRKNMRDNGYDDERRGVDLNRNWGCEWGYDNNGSSPNPSSQTYRGEAAFSEPETQAAREFINDHEFAITIYFHSYSNLCIYPLAYDFVHAPDRPVLMAAAEEFTADNNYLPGTGWEIIYLTNGDSDDWIYASDEHETAFAFTIEIGSRNDNFWPPLNRKQPLIDENIPVCIKAIDYSDNPYRSLNPRPPDEVVYWLDRQGQAHLEWNAPDDENNPPTHYRATARIPDEDFIDEVSLNNPLWEEFEINAYEHLARSEPYCYRVDINEPVGTLTLTREIIAPERIEAWIRCNLTRDNNLALEVTEDGYDWIAAPGRNTEDIIEAGYNHGPGLQDISTDDYEEYWWDLSDWEGKQVRIRFRYYEFGRYGRRDYCYIDDIGPLPGIEWQETIGDEIERTSWINQDERDENVVYCVQSIDAEGHVSFMSLPAVEIEERAQPEVLNIETGWSMISMPVELEEPRLENIFADLVHQDILELIKDGDGLFYAPEFGFNQIDGWDPLKGYWIKTTENAAVAFEGARLPENAPIPLAESWNLIAYLPSESMEAEDAFASLGDNLILAKDDMGGFMAVGFGFSNMEELESGEGYLLKVEEPDSLVYPVQEFANRRNLSLKKRNILQFEPLSSENHSLLILNAGKLGNGELYVKDAAGNIAGKTQVAGSEPYAGIAVWGKERSGAAGYEENDRFRLFWLDEKGEAEQKLSRQIVEGDLAYKPNGFTALNLDLQNISTAPEAASLTGIYPNPFNNAANISFEIHSKSLINLEIIDNAGRTVERVEYGILNSGVYSYSWNADGLPSGIYFIRFSAQNWNQTAEQLKKALLIR